VQNLDTKAKNLLCQFFHNIYQIFENFQNLNGEAGLKNHKPPTGGSLILNLFKNPKQDQKKHPTMV
jgi:hypothetical protein